MSATLFYAHHVHALLHHWPSLGGLPRLDLPTVGSPLGSEHLQHQPRLFWVVVEEPQPPCVHVTDLIARRLAELEARLAELTRARGQTGGAGCPGGGAGPGRLLRLLLDHRRLKVLTAELLTFPSRGRFTVEARCCHARSWSPWSWSC